MAKHPDAQWKVSERVSKEHKFVCSIGDADLWHKMLTDSQGQEFGTGSYRLYVHHGMGFTFNLNSLIDVLPAAVEKPEFRNIHSARTIRCVEKILELREPLEVYLRMLGER